MEEAVIDKETTSNVTEADVEAKVNAEAAKEQVVETDNKDTVKSPKTTNEKTTDNIGTKGQDSFDYRKNYEELRREFTRRTQEASDVKRQLQEIQSGYKLLADQFAKATEKPIDPEQFMRDFQTQGPKALDSYAKKYYVEPLAQKIHALESEAIDRNAKLAVLIRRADSDNYPDFKKLEDKMYEIIEKTPEFDNMPDIERMLDRAYEIARERSSVDAIKAAEEMGKAKAEAQIAKEARTAVATGGKNAGTSSADLRRMDFDKLEKLVESMHGVAEDR